MSASCFLSMVLVSTLLLSGCETVTALEQPSYDPLDEDPRLKLTELEFDLTYGSRERVVPVRVRFATIGEEPKPVILFSHGLGGSNRAGGYLAEHWARRGFVTVTLQHVGSDESAWREVAPADRMNALRRAANLRQTLNRIADVSAVIDALERWSVKPDHALAGRLDLASIGMSGHSYGAGTTQWVSGQLTPRGDSTADDRITAALMMSPSSPARGDVGEAFGAVQIPWMLMTGTNDVSTVNDRPVSSRLAVFPALPAGDKFELVLQDGEHHAFSDGNGRGRERNPNHHRVILALSTAFWDAYLRGDTAAAAWLKGNGPESVLEPGDRWQRK